MDFETRAIHEGQEPDPATGAITVPIYQTSTYAQEAVGEHKGYDYSRVANPTRTALQLCLASLESAEHGVAFSSLFPLSLVGASRRVVARRGLAFQMRVHAVDPMQTQAPEGMAGLRRLDRLPELLAESDFVVIAAPQTPHMPRARSWQSTTRSQRRTCSARSSSARTSSSTPPRSISAATRTSSAGSRRRTIRRSRSGCTSCRSHSARCPGRSTAGSCCAA